MKITPQVNDLANIWVKFPSSENNHVYSKYYMINVVFRLTDDLVSHILKMTVRESSDLLREAATCDKDRFDDLLASVPVCTQCSSIDRLVRTSNHFMYIYMANT